MNIKKEITVDNCVVNRNECVIIKQVRQFVEELTGMMVDMDKSREGSSCPRSGEVGDEQEYHSANQQSWFGQRALKKLVLDRMC